MSWLYTVIFAGLMFSSQGKAVSATESGVQSPTVALQAPVSDETEKFSQSYPINANGRVNVSNVNGSITVEGWDKNEVKLEYTKVADSKERLADVEIRIELKPEYFSVETDYGNWTSRNGNRWKNGSKLNVEIHMMVPRGAVLNEIQTVNGSVAVSNFVNSTRASAVNGSVNATNIRGTARLSTVNGEVVADFDQLESGSKISLETVNGKVNLLLPSDANATIKADSLNGNITNDFGLPVRKGKYVGRDLYGKLGSGEIQIRLNSVNGGLSIGHKNDGKNLSPAINLLPQKGSDDDNWDSGSDREDAFRSAKIDKEVAKAAKEGAKASAKVAAKAMADAQVEINALQPEIAKITADSMAIASDALKKSAEIMKSDAMKRTLKINKGLIADIQNNINTDVLAKLSDISFSPTVPRVEKKSESFPVKGMPKVTVDAKGCAVTVRGWDKSEVRYRVVQFSGQLNRTPLNITADHSESSVTVRVNNTDIDAQGGHFNGDVNRTRIELFVPKKSNLKIKTDGEIRLEGVSGDVDLSGSDESITVRDVDGTLQVSSSDGRIRVIGFKGEITAQSSDGMISLEGDFRKLTAKAGDGSIFLTLPDNVQADLEASRENIQGEGLILTRVGVSEKVSKYRIGNGGANFQIETGGEIHVRGAGVLKESF